jgi:hypothetical protein
VVVHRSDGSGTTFGWTDYLSSVSPDWQSKVGKATSVNWPVGLGGSGNNGVAGEVQQNPYSLGYVELIYALQNKLDYGSVKNKDGQFVEATLDSVTAAASASLTSIPPDLRVEASGYQAIALTVDVQLYGRRERDILARFSPRKAMEIAPNPRGPNPEYQARLTWADVEWLLKTTRLPVGIKGIMTVRDARRAVDMGVRLIWVSNHGGRQLDHTQSTIDALPPIVDAVAGAAEIVIDGGFSRGTDVVKGLARGATAVAVGRTVLWGLGADGAPGVARALEILREEVRTTLGLCGRTRIADLTPDLIFRID